MKYKLKQKVYFLAETVVEGTVIGVCSHYNKADNFTTTNYGVQFTEGTIGIKSDIQEEVLFESREKAIKAGEDKINKEAEDKINKLKS